MLGLIMNCGSSSLKCRLINTTDASTLYEARAVHLGTEKAKLTINSNSQTKVKLFCKDHKSSINAIVDDIVEHDDSVGKILETLNELDFVAHRIVHGGAFFSEPTVITDEVLEKVESCNKLARLHNPIGIEGVKIMKSLLPEKIPQIAVFDTAFHQTIPPENFIYPIPKKFQKMGIRKYGFHGISYAYSMKNLKEEFNVQDEPTILAHLGQGASVCAVKEGKSVYTSMGFSPLSGLIMGTRAGNIDSTIIQFLVQNTEESIDEIFNDLNKESGWQALAGSNNMVDIIEGAVKQDQDSVLTLEMFCNSVVDELTNGMRSLKELPTKLVFSGGIGENSSIIRKMIIEKLQLFLPKIELDSNANASDLSIISTQYSSVDIYVIKVNEELEIAMEAVKLLEK